jgi:hypothetical protein
MMMDTTKLLNWVKATGYPLELEAERILSKLGYAVLQYLIQSHTLIKIIR